MPRSSELTPAARRTNGLALGIAVVFVLVGAFAVAAPWVVRSRDLAIDRHGDLAMATIEAVSPSLAAGGDGEYTISYSFATADGHEQGTTRSVPTSFWRSAVEGQMVEVRYDAADPANNHPVGTGQTSVALAIFVSGVGLVIGAFGLVVVVAARRFAPG